MRRGKTGIVLDDSVVDTLGLVSCLAQLFIQRPRRCSALPLVQMSWKFESRLKQLPRLKGFPPACPINSISILRIFAERENGGSPNRNSSPYRNSKFFFYMRLASEDARFSISAAVWAEDLPSLLDDSRIRTVLLKQIAPELTCSGA